MKQLTAFLFTIAIMLAWGCSTARTAVPSVVTTATIPAMASITPTLSPTPIPSPTATSTPAVLTATNIASMNEEFRIGKGQISDVFWTQDGNVVVLYASGLTVYDVSGKVIRSSTPENKAISTDSTLSPDGKYVASLVDNKSVLIWDSNSGKIQHQFQINCNAVPETLTHKVAFSRDGQQVAACDAGGVSIWDLSSESKINTLPVKNGAPSIVMFSSVSGQLIVTSSRGPRAFDTNFDSGFGDLEILDIGSGKALATFKYPQEGVVSPITINHAGDELAWATASNEVQLYDLKARKTLQTLVVKFTGIYPGAINSLDFSPDDKTIAVSSSYYSGTSLVDIASGKVISSPNNIAADVIKYSPDGNYFAAGWDGITIYASNASQKLASLGTFLTYSTVSFNSKGSYMAIGDGFLTLWDLQDKTQILQNNFQSFGWLFAFTPDGNQFIANDWNGSDWDHKIAAYTLFGNRSEIGNITDPSSNSLISRPKVSPSSAYVALGIGGNSIKVVSLSSHAVVTSLSGQPFSDFEFSPDGKSIATAGYGITFWDYVSGKQIKTIGSDPTNDVAFSPDGTLIAGSSFAKGALVWNTNTGEMVHQFKDANGSIHVAFGPQGNTLASLSYDNDDHAFLDMWDVASGKLLFNKTGSKVFSERWNPGSDPADFTFSPDGSMIAVKGLDDHIEFIDTTTGNTIKTLDTVKVDYIDQNDSDLFGFSADGRQFAVAGADGIVRIFTVQP